MWTPADRQEVTGHALKTTAPGSRAFVEMMRAGQEVLYSLFRISHYEDFSTSVFPHSREMRLLRPSVCPRGSVRIPQEEFSCSSIGKFFTKISWHVLILSNIENQMTTCFHSSYCIGLQHEYKKYLALEKVKEVGHPVYMSLRYENNFTACLTKMWGEKKKLK